MPEALLIKLGGSLITDKTRPGVARPEVIVRLAAEIARAAAAGEARLVLGHGSGSFGHVAAARHRLAQGLDDPGQLPGIPETQQSAADLHRQVVTALRQAGALPYSIAPSSTVIFEDGKPAAFHAEPLKLALDAGLLPVLYGDVVTDRGRGIGICSTETALDLAARELPGWGYPVHRALWLGETAGFLDGRGRTVPRLTPADLRDLLATSGPVGMPVGSPAASQAAVSTQVDPLADAIRPPDGTDVTGGMRLRLATALTLAERGITSLLADGRVPGLLERALAGDEVPGTVITPA